MAKRGAKVEIEGSLVLKIKVKSTSNIREFEDGEVKVYNLPTDLYYALNSLTGLLHNVPGMNHTVWVNDIPTKLKLVTNDHDNRDCAVFTRVSVVEAIGSAC